MKKGLPTIAVPNKKNLIVIPTGGLGAHVAGGYSQPGRPSSPLAVCPRDDSGKPYEPPSYQVTRTSTCSLAFGFLHYYFDSLIYILITIFLSLSLFFFLL